MRRLGVKRGGDDLDLPACLGIDHADRVAVGTGHVEQVLVGRKGHFRGMRRRGPGGLDRLPSRGSTTATDDFPHRLT